MSQINLILKDISDIYTRENFKRITSFLNDQVLFDGDFEFFEVDIPQAATKFPIKHGLTFIPSDIISLSIQGNQNVYFNYDSFDRLNIYATTAGPCVLRFLAGRLSNGAKSPIKGKYPAVPPSAGGGSGSISSITSLSPGLIVHNPSGPTVSLELSSSLTAASATSLVVTRTAIEDILAGEPVYSASATQVGLATANDIVGKAKVLGVAKNSALAGSSVVVILFGTVIDTAYSVFSLNDSIFLANGGSLQNTRPSLPSNSYLTEIGNYLGSNTIFVSPRTPVKLV